MTRDPKAREDHLLRMFKYWRARALKAERGLIIVPPRGGWKTLDTAPKNGEHVLVATSEGVVLEAYYEADDDRGWYASGSHHTDAHDGAVQRVVAWRHLPSPPTPGAQP